MYKIVKRVIILYYPLLIIGLFYVFCIELSTYELFETNDSVWTQWTLTRYSPKPRLKNWTKFSPLFPPLLFILLTITKEIIRQVCNNNIVIDNVRSSLFGILNSENKAEKWAIALGWWIPRKFRGPLIGDILEDCYEMRNVGCSELRIRTQVLWQWLVGVLLLIPTTIFSAVWRILSQSK